MAASPKKSLVVIICIFLALYFTTYIDFFTYQQVDFVHLKSQFIQGCPEEMVLTKKELGDLTNLLYEDNLVNFNQFKGEMPSLPEIYKIPDTCLENVKIVTIGFKSLGLRSSLFDYRSALVEKFKKKYANPGGMTCVKKRCELEPYKKDDPRRLDPDTLIKNKKKEINDTLIAEELEKLKRFHLSKGDDDLTEMIEIFEEKVASTLNGYKIPNIVHYVWFGCGEYRISTYLAMLSALKYQNPALILVHTNCPPKGVYWDLFKGAAGSKLKIVKKSPPEEIFGKKVKVVEHQADVSRLQIMLQVGGMYFDTDLLVLKNLDSLRRDHDIVLGEASPISLANGGILANKNSWFLKRWFQEYQNFTDGQWGKSSVKTPMALWQIFPEEIHVVEVTMMRPNWMEYKMLHHGFFDWSKHLTLHLSVRFMDKWDKKRNILQFAILNTSYGEVARYILWGETPTRDITPWILHPKPC